MIITIHDHHRIGRQQRRHHHRAYDLVFDSEAVNVAVVPVQSIKRDREESIIGNRRKENKQRDRDKKE